MTTTFWKSFTECDALDAVRELEQVKSTEYEHADVLHAFGLPVSSSSQVGACDQWSFTKASEGSGPSQLATDLINAFGQLCRDKFCDLPKKMTESVSYRDYTEIVVANVSTYRTTFDNLQDHCDCFQVSVVSRHPQGQKHMPFIFLFWVYRNYLNNEIRVVLVETPRDYRPALRGAITSPISICVRTVSTIHTLNLSGKVNGASFTIVPWAANKLLNCSVRDLRANFEPTSNGSSAKLKKGVLQQADVQPIFIYAHGSRDYEEAAVAAVDGGRSVQYVHYWHSYSDLDASVPTSSAVCTATVAGEVHPANALYFGTNAGKQVTGVCVAVRIRENGRYLYVVQRREKPVFVDTNRIGVVPSARRELLERCFAVDQWGTIAIITAKKKPVLMHTAITNAIRNELLGTPETVTYVKHMASALSAITAVADRTKSFTYEWEELGLATRMRWKHDTLNASGILYVRQAVTPGTGLLGVLSPWQNVNGPGSGDRNWDQSSEYWYPADGRSGIDKYTPMMYLDSGLSLLGRYMMQDYISTEYYLDTTKVLLPKVLRDDGVIGNATRYNVGPDMCGKLDVVIDIEYSPLPGGDDKIPTALGAVCAEDGTLVNVAAEIQPLDAITKAGLLEQVDGRLQPRNDVDASIKSQASAYIQLRKRIPEGQVWAHLAMLNVLSEASEQLTLWAKGADNDAIFIKNARGPDKSRDLWSTAKEEGRSMLAEGELKDLGAEMPKFAVMANRHNVSTQHHPGTEAALFALEGGLWRKEPDMRRAVFNSNKTCDQFLLNVCERLYALDEANDVDMQDWIDALIDGMSEVGLATDYACYEWALAKMDALQPT
nr:P4 protein [Fusarium proliferatum chrysovirus 1]